MTSHLTQKKGEVTALIGVNGIGKTTIMNCIAGLLPFDKGKVVIDDMPARKVFAEKVSYITDSSIISPDQTVMKRLILCAHSIRTGIVKRKDIY